jgi:hypothetical protein
MSNNTRRAWTDEEYGFVMDSPLPTRAVAEKLGRTVASVEHAKLRLRKGWIPGRPGAWSEIEDQYVLDSMGRDPSDVAEYLGRSKNSIINRRRVLRKSGVARQVGTKNASPFRVGTRTLLARTCPGCGMLLEAKWFKKSSTTDYRLKTCTRCRVAKDDRRYGNTWDSAHQWRQEQQALSLPTATNHYKPWQESEMEVLMDPSLTILEKAIKLKRTFMSVANAERLNGFTSRNPNLGNPTEEQWLIDNPNADKFDEITANVYMVRELVDAGSHNPQRPEFDWDD